MQPLSNLICMLMAVIQKGCKIDKLMYVASLHSVLSK